jgi:hypothetical protein
MSGLINLIKSLFSGIFGFLGGLLGSKKKKAGSDTTSEQPAPKKGSNGFYLELEDAKSVDNTSAPSQATEPTEAPAAATKKSGKKSSKRAEQLAAAKAEAETNNKSAEPARALQPAAAAKALNLPQPAVTNFATDYLLPTSTNGRRRPGANMASYLDMARSVKAPGRG